MKFSVSILTVLVLFTACSSIQMQGEKFQPVTEDGWPLTVEYFPAVEGVAQKARPVVIAHGLLANRKYFKINEENSITAMLNRAGYNVYLIDLRARDDAGSASWFFGDHTYNYNMDDYILRDVDRALSFVTEHSGAEKVNWIGHSMGGMIAYARIGTYKEGRIANLVTIGSPMDYPPLPESQLLWYRLSGARVLLPMTPLELMTGFANAVPVFRLDHVERSLIYPENTDDEIIEKLMVTCTNNVAHGVLDQFLALQRDHVLKSADGRLNYTENMKNIRVPALVIAGRRDHLGDPMGIKVSFDRIGSSDKTLFIAARSNGLSEDYGHTDMLVGRRAHEEIHPLIIDWLDRHNSESESSL